LDRREEAGEDCLRAEAVLRNCWVVAEDLLRNHWTTRGKMGGK
jgi:hypothetical protein